MKEVILFITLIIIINGCTYASKMNHLSLGMTKREVIKIMGNPNSTRAIEGIETLVYSLYSSHASSYPGDYWVHLRSGKVTDYGIAE